MEPLTERQERAGAIIEALDASDISEQGREARDVEAVARRFEAAVAKADQARRRSAHLS